MRRIFTGTLVLALGGCSLFHSVGKVGVERNYFNLLTADSIKFWQFNPNKRYQCESGLIFTSDSSYDEYYYNYLGKRVLGDSATTYQVRPFLFRLSSDTIFVKAWPDHIFKIVEINRNKLVVRDLSYLIAYHYMWNYADTITFYETDDHSRPVAGPFLNPDSSTWRVRVVPR